MIKLNEPLSGMNDNRLAKKNDLSKLKMVLDPSITCSFGGDLGNLPHTIVFR